MFIVKNGRSIRINEYDYTQQGAYFVTIHTAKGAPVLSCISATGVTLTDIGRIVVQEWHQTEYLRSNVKLDVYVVMPNHIHAMIWLTEPSQSESVVIEQTESFGKPVVASLSTIVRAFKASVTRRFHLMRGYENKALWQRNFFEHIIRDENDYYLIYDYILLNPARWDGKRDEIPDL